MEGTLAHSMIPTMESATTDVDRKCGSLDVDLDRKFLNNNNITSMKCLQFTRPPDSPPPPALLFDYVVEKSIQSQAQQHNLLDSEIKSFENISFTSNSDEQSANSQVDEVVTNSPSVNSRPVVETEVAETKEANMPKTGTDTAKHCVNSSVTNASTNHTSSHNTTKPSSPIVVTPTIITTTPEDPLITIRTNHHESSTNHPNHKHHPIIVSPAQQSKGVCTSTSSVTMYDMCHPIVTPPLPSSITTDKTTNNDRTCEANGVTFADATTVAAVATTSMAITASAATCSSKPPTHANSHHLYHQHYPQLHLHHPHNQLPFGFSNTCSPHSVRFMTQHIKILPKTQSLDLVDNDDLLEATNRTESQLEINTAGVTFKGRVLPKLQPLDQTRPIYPNVPYSPYNSPYGSPRSGRRRTPLRESRRVSIEQSGSFLQLNQYKLLDQIGQVS